MRKKLLSLIIMIFLMLILSCILSYTHLTINTYDYQSDKVTEDMNLVVISDLHDNTFGDKNHRLVSKVTDLSPDAILLLGDMLDDVSDNADVPCELIEQLKLIAPVYYALGNHELEFMQIRDVQLIEKLTAAGAVVLDKDYVDIAVKGNQVRLGGLYEYAFGMADDSKLDAASMEIKTFLKDYQNTDALKIMMSHRPDSFVFGDASEYWDIDLVVSGHNHGGQVVLPFLGGLYGGDQGYFPKYVHGMYEKGNMNIFVTSGLGSNFKILPRFNNPPEIAVIEIKDR